MLSDGSHELRVSIVCHALGVGGAARATERLVQALRGWGDDAVRVEVRTPTMAGRSEPWHRRGLPAGSSAARRWVSRRVASAAARLPWGTGNPILHSRADVWTGLGRELDREAPDVINLHWLGTGTLSVEEIGRLRPPTVLTLHDMWAFCGAEHYTDDDRFVQGYPRGARPPGESGLDWNRIVWRRKRRSWRRPMTVVAPSRWLADCARRSALMSDWPVHVIPNPIDVDLWQPLDRRFARSLLGLPDRAPVILFGAVGGESQHIKGGDLLLEALRRLPSHLTEDATGSAPVLAVFGGKRSLVEESGRLPFPIHHLGRIGDDRLLRAAYSAADVMVVPSRLDNLPNTAVEAMACGTPVAAFRIGGLPDIVEDRVNGRIVQPFDVDALAAAVAELLQDADSRGRMAARSREAVVQRYRSAVVRRAYADLYREVALSPPPISPLDSEG